MRRTRSDVSKLPRGMPPPPVFFSDLTRSWTWQIATSALEKITDKCNEKDHLATMPMSATRDIYGEGNSQNLSLVNIFSSMSIGQRFFQMVIVCFLF